MTLNCRALGLGRRFTGVQVFTHKFSLTRFTAISLMGLISAVKEGLKKAMHSSGGMAFSFPKNAHRTSRF